MDENPRTAGSSPNTNSLALEHAALYQNLSACSKLLFGRDVLRKTGTHFSARRSKASLTQLPSFRALIQECRESRHHYS
jgi:hypothetical protein